MYLVIGQNQYSKHEYSEDEAFINWLKAKHFPTTGEVQVIEFACEKDKVCIDGLGTVSFPAEAKRGELTIDLAQHADTIRRLDDTFTAYDELCGDLTYDVFNGGDL